MKVKLDSLDEKLAILLGKDATRSSEQLAEKLNVSAATVRRRIKKLTQNGLLHIVGVVHPADFGYPLAAVIALNVDQNRVSKTVKDLSKRREVRWLSATTGHYDIILGGRFSSVDALADFIAKDLSKIEGLKDIETFICLKQEWDPLIVLR